MLESERVEAGERAYQVEQVELADQVHWRIDFFRCNPWAFGGWDYVAGTFTGPTIEDYWTAARLGDLWISEGVFTLPPRASAAQKEGVASANQ